MLALRRDATIDGEVVVCDAIGVAISSCCTANRQAFLYAFDLLELDGADLRPFLLERRMLLSGCTRGIQYSEHLEDDGATIFAHACRLGCEAIDGIPICFAGARYYCQTTRSLAGPVHRR